MITRPAYEIEKKSLQNVQEMQGLIKEKFGSRKEPTIDDIQAILYRFNELAGILRGQLVG